MGVALLRDDDLHGEASALEGETILGVVDAESAADAFGWLEYEPSGQSLRGFEGLEGVDTEPRCLDLEFCAYLPETAVVPRETGAVKAGGLGGDGALEIDLLLGGEDA